MRRWLIPVLMLGAIVAIGQLPRPIAWTVIAVVAAVMWYFVMTAFPHSRRWEDVKDDDHRRDSPRSSR